MQIVRHLSDAHGAGAAGGDRELSGAVRAGITDGDVRAAAARHRHVGNINVQPLSVAAADGSIRGQRQRTGGRQVRGIIVCVVNRAVRGKGDILRIGGNVIDRNRADERRVADRDRPGRADGIQLRFRDRKVSGGARSQSDRDRGGRFEGHMPGARRNRPRRGDSEIIGGHHDASSSARRVQMNAGTGERQRSGRVVCIGVGADGDRARGRIRSGNLRGEINAIIGGQRNQSRARRTDGRVDIESAVRVCGQGYGAIAAGRDGLSNHDPAVRDDNDITTGRGDPLPAIAQGDAICLVNDNIAGSRGAGDESGHGGLEVLVGRLRPDSGVRGHGQETGRHVDTRTRICVRNRSRGCGERGITSGRDRLNRQVIRRLGDGYAPGATSGDIEVR